MSGADFGYDKERFPNLNGESFDCIICACVVKNPRECTNCGSMFCAGCIESWLKKTKYFIKNILTYSLGNVQTDALSVKAPLGLLEKLY
jgi:Uncharacterized conserved protein, contains RING Zn-finger